MRWMLAALLLLPCHDTEAQMADRNPSQSQPAVPATDLIVIENEGSRLALGADATLHSFYHKALGQEQMLGAPAPFFAAELAGQNLPATALTRSADDLHVTFGADQARATIRCDVHPYFVGLRLQSWEPSGLAGITLAELSLRKLATAGASMGVTYDDRAAAGLQVLHYAGSQEFVVTADTVRLRSTFPAQRGLDQAGCALLACPRARLATTIQEIEKTYGLPSPRIDGAWGKQSPLMYRSYFFVHDLSEVNVEQVIAMAQRGGFGYIQILEDAWSHGGGTHALNERNFPHGRDGLKAVVARLHEAGFRVGLHFLAAGMRGTDPLVSPVPDEGLYYATQTPLAASIDERDAFLPTATPPDSFPVEDGGYEGSGTYLRVGNEVIWYRTVSLVPPYGFVDCTRGALQSTPAAHQAGALMRHMKKAYGLFLIDADSPLMDKVADNVARTFKYCDVDGMYFDGSEALQGDHNYYNARIQMAYARACGKTDLICQGSSYSSYTWHLISRMASADGYRDIKYYLDKRSPAFISWYDANLMPIDIGWYGCNPYIRPDDIEYVASRAIGFNASLSISTGLETLQKTVQGPEMIDLVGRWEKLRLSGRVPDSVRALMREPGQEFRLVDGPRESLLVPVEYSAWATVPAAGDRAGSLALRNRRPSPAQVELQVECGEAIEPGAAYARAQALELFESEPPGEHSPNLDHPMFSPFVHGDRATSQGVTQEVSLVTDDVREGQSACRFQATSTLKTPGGWATFGRSFAPPLSLREYGAIGLWVKGDGQREVLKVQLWDAQERPQDQVVVIDFVGWRFVELPRPIPEPVDYHAITRVQFYYNGIPAEATVDITIDGVKVLPGPTVLANPEVRVGDRAVVFPVTMRPGERLLYRGRGDCWLSRPGEDRQAVPADFDLPAVSDTLAVTAAPSTHRLELRAALLWPELAVRVAAPQEE